MHYGNIKFQAIKICFHTDHILGGKSGVSGKADQMWSFNLSNHMVLAVL